MWPRNQKRISLVPKTWHAGDHYRDAGSYQLRCCYIRALGQQSRVWHYPAASYCAAPRSQGVSEMKSWLPGKKRGGARKGSERKQLGEGKRAFAYGKFSLSPTVYQRCIFLKTLQKITSDREFTAYLVDEARAFDKTSQSR